MKTHIIQRTLLPAALAFILAGSSLDAKSQVPGTPVVQQAVEPSPLEVKYMGYNAEYLYFNVQFNASEAGKRLLVVKGRDGETLYSQAFEGTTLNRRFAFNRGDESGQLKFQVVENKRVREQKLFDIQPVTRMTSTVEVTRLR